MTQRRGAATSATMVGTLATYATNVLAMRWDIPLEVASAGVGLALGWFVSRYHRSIRPWEK